MILLFTIGGRTGNLLFQLGYALSVRRKNEWLISVGFKTVRSIVEGPCRHRWHNIEGRLARAFMERVIHPVIYRACVRTGLLSSDYENNDRWEVRRGRIRWVRVIKGYFQSSLRLAPNLAETMRLKERFRDRARLILAAMAGGRTPVFIHIRRTDYKGVTIEGGVALLPDRYYLEAARRIRADSPLFYVITGDDPDHAERLFADLEPKYVSRRSLEDDLALMTFCEGGVLSNSNFAWWGAFFSSARLGYVAPKYWSGWRVKKWYPPELRGSFVTEYLDVESP